MSEVRNSLQPTTDELEGTEVVNYIDDFKYRLSSDLSNENKTS